MKIRLSDYLKVDDVREPRTVTIREIKVQEFGKRDEPKEEKYVVFFEGEDRGVVCPMRGVAFKGLLKAAGIADGADTDDLIGKRVELYVDENVSYEGRLVGGLRFQKAK